MPELQSRLPGSAFWRYCARRRGELFTTKHSAKCQHHRSNSQIPDGNEVTFKPETGTVNVSGLGISTTRGTPAEHIAFEGLTFTDFTVISSGNDVHFTRCTFRALFMALWANYYSVRNSDIGSHNGADGLDLYGNVDGVQPTNGLIENNIIHDISTTDPLAHPDALATYGVNNLTVRGNKFYKNACINYRGDGADRGTIVIENNTFGQTVSYAGGISCGPSAQIHGDGALIRYNTIEGSIQQVGSGEGDGQLWEGNIITGNVGYGQCPVGSGTIAQYNVWNSNNPTNCGGAANVGLANLTSMFVTINPTGSTGSDLHLVAGAAAIDRGNPSRYPSTDIDGKTRPIGGGPDAGADEFGTTAKPNPPTNLSLVIN